MENKEYLIEDYRFAKTELLSTIESQFTILSILVTASAAVFVFIFGQDSLSFTICGCLIIPGLYAFFGILWLDQVYRQRRLAMYILTIERTKEFSGQTIEGNFLHLGWETFIKSGKKYTSSKIPSRLYYFVCLGLFLFFPSVTSIFAMCFGGINIFHAERKIFYTVVVGALLYLAYLIFSTIYVVIILKLDRKYNSHLDTVSVQSKDRNDVRQQGESHTTTPV